MRNMNVLVWYIAICTSCVACLPNIVILLADDLGIGDVGCFGNDSIHTPNIDAIADAGVKLTHHLTAAAVCTPSRAALLTGRYPVRSGMESSARNKVIFFVAASGGLPQNETTVAKALKQKGYSTALIGKWHLGNDCSYKGDLCHHPLSHGFDRFYGLPLSNFKDMKEGQSVITAYDLHIYKYIAAVIVCGLTAALTIFKTRRKLGIFVFFVTVILPAVIAVFLLNLRIINGILMRDNIVVEQPLNLDGLTQRFVRESKEFIEDSIRTSAPFFLYLPFVHVHTALFSSPEFCGKSKFGQYGDNIEELDWAVGEIVSTLKKHGVFNNTLLYFSSDNGGHIEEFNQNGEREGGHNGIFRGGKTMAGFEGGIRVPSLISWPDKISGGREIKVPTSQMDIFPTVTEVAGIAPPSDRQIDGKSLLPILFNERLDSPHRILFHYCGTSIHAATYIPSKGDSVWKIHWTTPAFIPGTSLCGYICHCYGKFVVHHDPPLLFDLTKDPSESHVLDIEKNAEYKNIISTVDSFRKEHEAGVQPVPDQFNFWNTVWKPWLQPCCNFPRCSCKDPKYS